MVQESGLVHHFEAEPFLKTVPQLPGVYAMQDLHGKIIYVGKANNLRKRLASYFRPHIDEIKTRTLVEAIADIQITVTRNETEALLLEQGFIKQHQPRYNVLMRDDSSYPYLLLTKETHPRLLCHHGPKKIQGEYFGPFTNSKAVQMTLDLLQKLFPLRSCSNSVYRHRSRPCLQYQMGRCLGPCVPGLADEQLYQQQVNYVRLFLRGRDQQVIAKLVEQMEHASTELKFEAAARIRDQIQAIRQVGEKQFVANHDPIPLDVISIAQEAGVACVQVLFLRYGSLTSSRSYFPKFPPGTTIEEVGATFANQFYLQPNPTRDLPDLILLDFPFSDKDLLARSMQRIEQRPIKIHIRPRGKWLGYVQLARTNAVSSLQGHLAKKSTIQGRLTALAEQFSLPPLNRLECFDISHTLGSQTVASCVVFDRSGPLRSEYRCYNVSDIDPGDDCAAIAWAIRRRYSSKVEQRELPDLIIVDGGKGQLRAAIVALQECMVTRDGTAPVVIGIAKGPGRKPGTETLFLAPKGQKSPGIKEPPGEQVVKLPSDSKALHLIQQLRDEAHHHAVSGHRRRRRKVQISSQLEQIPGVGAKRREALLKYMGGLKPLLKATPEEISKVPNISAKLAEKIYAALNIV